MKKPKYNNAKNLSKLNKRSPTVRAKGSPAIIFTTHSIKAQRPLNKAQEVEQRGIGPR